MIYNYPPATYYSFAYLPNLQKLQLAQKLYKQAYIPKSKQHFNETNRCV